MLFFSFEWWKNVAGDKDEEGEDFFAIVCGFMYSRFSLVVDY